MKTCSIHRHTLQSLLLGLIAAVPLTAQVAETSVRRQDGATLIYNPSLTWSEGNYHTLHNGAETALFPGLGSGGASVPGVDGIGTWIPGEELRGNNMTSLGDFGYRQVAFRETVAVVAGGPNMIDFPHIAWLEFDWANGHAPVVFTNPTDNNCATWSLGIDTVGYGSPGGQASFIALTTPSGENLVVPNEHLLSGPGTATISAEIFNLQIPIPAAGFFWEVQIEWISPLESKDDIDGWYHWARSSPQGNQYFAMSDDELNLWHSYTIPTQGAFASILTLPAKMDYALTMLSADPVTYAALAPVGTTQPGPYQFTSGAGVFNNGFDIGRGSQMVSLSGIGGVTDSATGFANQDPAGAAILGYMPSLGFVTFDNTDYDGDGDLVATPPVGTQRITWVSVDWDVIFGVDPALATSATVFLGAVRVPIQIPSSSPTPWPTGLTMSFLPVFIHATAPLAWPDPGGFGATPGEFGVPMVTGTSIHIPLGSVSSVCTVGLPIALQYGSSGLVTSSGPLTWDPLISRVSGTRQLFLFD